MAISTNGTVLARVAGALYNTQMSNATYSEVKTLDPASLVNTLYSRDFASVSDLTVATTLVANLGLSTVTGLNNWVAAQLTAAGSANKGAKIVDLLNSFAQMTADTTYGAYATAFNTKVDAALALSQTTGNTGGTFAAANVLSGATFTLTANTDNIVGTAGDDVISSSSSTFNSDDNIAGGAGNDTFTVTTAGAGSVIGNFTSVETLKVTNGSGTNTDNFSINLIGATGVTEVQSRLSSAYATFSNLQAAAKVSAFGTVSGADITATFLNSLAAGTADSASVKVDGGAVANFDVKGTGSGVFETINLESAGISKNTVTFSSTVEGGANTYNVAGAGELAISFSVPKAKSTFDASAATGAVTLTLTDDTSTTTSGQNVDTIKTGAGDDTVDLSAVATGANNSTTTVLGFFDDASTTASTNNSNKKTVDLGAGNNTLIINEDLATLAATAATDGTAQTHSVTNVQTLVLKQGAAQDNAIDASLIASATTVEIKPYAADDDNVDALDTITLTKLVATQTVKVTDAAGADAADGTKVSVAIKDATGTADSVNVTLNNTAASKALGVLTVAQTSSANVETLNLASTGTSSNSLTSLDAGYTTTVNISGAKAMTIVGVELNDPTTTGVTAVIDATAATGGITLGSSSADFKATNSDEFAIKLGAGTNKVYAADISLDNDSIVGSTGTDTVYLTEGSSSTALKTTLTNIDVVNVTAIANDRTFDTTNWTGIGKIQVVSSTDSGNTADDVTFSKVAAGQVVEALTSSGKTFEDSDVITISVATGVTSATVNLAGPEALAASGSLSLKTDAGALSVTDGIKSTSTGYYSNETFTIDGTASTAKITKLTLAGGGASSSTATAGITVSAGSNVALTAIDASTLSSNLNIAGISSVTSAGAVVTLGAGNNTLTIAEADAARDALVIRGGDGADTLTITTLDNATYRPGTSSVETLNLTMKDASAGAVTFDLTDTSDITTLKLDVNSAEHGFTLSKGAVSAVSLAGDFVGSAGTDATVALDTADSVVVKNTAALGADNTVLTLATALTATIKQGYSADIDFETLNLTKATSLTLGGTDVDSSNAAYAGAINANTLSSSTLTSLTVDTTEGNVSLGTVTAAKLATVTASGAGSFSFGATDASTAALATFNASAATGAVTVGQGVDFASGATVTLGTGNDTITLDILTEGGVTVDGGSKTSDNDTLKLAGVNNMGVSVVDLSSSSDQLTQLNGSLNSAAQTKFESIDLSGLSGTFGANITGSSAANTIVGTANVDNIVAGEGADTITGGSGDDTIDLSESTAAADKVVFTSDHAATAINNDGTDTITGFGTGDKLSFTDATLLTFVKGGVSTGTALDNAGTDSTTATSGSGAADAKIDFSASGGITTIKIDLDSDGTDVSYLTIKLVGTFTDLTKWVVAADGLVWNG